MNKLYYLNVNGFNINSQMSICQYHKNVMADIIMVCELRVMIIMSDLNYIGIININ